MKPFDTYDLCKTSLWQEFSGGEKSWTDFLKNKYRGIDTVPYFNYFLLVKFYCVDMINKIVNYCMKYYFWDGNETNLEGLIVESHKNSPILTSATETGHTKTR